MSEANSPLERSDHKKFAGALNTLVDRLGQRLGRNHDGVLLWLADAVHVAQATVGNWHAGRYRPSDPRALTQLAEIGCTTANLDEDWGDRLLTYGGHDDPVSELVRIWKLPKIIPSNLGVKQHQIFVGREAELLQLFKLLDHRQSSTNPVFVEGAAGAGKTTLVVEAAHCIASRARPFLPKFDYIVFVSAKQFDMIGSRLEQLPNPNRSWDEVFREISRVLDLPEPGGRQDFDEQLDILREKCATHAILLILDNYETMDETQLSQLNGFLADIPPKLKVVVTTRDPSPSPIRSIELSVLSPGDARSLVDQAIAMSAQLGINAGTVISTDKLVAALASANLLFPGVVRFVLDRMALGLSQDGAIDDLTDAEGGYISYAFNHLIDDMREDDQHADLYRVLLCMTLFPKRPSWDSVFRVADLDPASPRAAQVRRTLRSLYSFGREAADNRYSVSPLARELLRAKATSELQIMEAARERWHEYYRSFVATHASEHRQDWHQHYELIDDEWENIKAVYTWLYTRHDVEGAFEFWRRGTGLDTFTRICGHVQDRVAWLDWFVEESRRAARHSLFAEAAAARAYTYAISEQYGAAQDLLHEAWNLKDEIPPLLRSWVAQTLGICHAWRASPADLDESDRWLDEASSQLVGLAIDSAALEREHLTIQFFRAENWRHRGNLQEAYKLYDDMRDRSRLIAWNRAAAYAHYGLGRVATELGRLEEADDYLRIAREWSKQNHDDRRLAFVERALCRLARRRDLRKDIACEYARQARARFANFRIIGRASEMTDMLREMGCP